MLTKLEYISDKDILMLEIKKLIFQVSLLEQAQNKLYHLEKNHHIVIKVFWVEKLRNIVKNKKNETIISTHFLIIDSF